MNKQFRCFCCFFVVVIFFFIQAPSFACVCGGAIPPPCVEFAGASAVFVGEITDIKPVLNIDGHQALIHFSIKEAYKGISGSQVIVWASQGSDCDNEFEKGKQYFVYAYQSKKKHRLELSICSRTRQFNSDLEDVAYARALNGTKPKTTILGTDNYGFSSFLKGAEIIVEGNNKEYRAIADKQGAFKIELPQGGKYKVTVIGLSGYVFLNHLNSWKVFTIQGRPAVEFEREVVDGLCDFVDFSQYLTVLKQK